MGTKTILATACLAVLLGTAATAGLGAGQTSSKATVAPRGASPLTTLGITGTGFSAVAAANSVIFRHLASGFTVTAPATTVETKDVAQGLRRLGLPVPADFPIGTTSVSVVNTATSERSEAGNIEVIRLYLPEAVTGALGATVAVRVTGSANVKFVAGTKVTFGDGVTVKSVAVESPTSLLATVVIAAKATIGPRTLTLVTPNQPNQEGIAPSIFSVTQPNVPGNRNPTATLEVPASGPTGVALSFAGGGSDPDGDELAFTWNFGDQAMAGGPGATHAYAAPGTYTVTLTVIDRRGGTGTAQASIVVTDPPTGNQSPTASAGGPYAGQSNAAIAFSGSGTDPDGDTLTLTWDFGDNASGSGASPTHAYAAAGSYVATLTVTDGHGGTATAQASVVVTNPPPPNQNPAANAGGPYAGQSNAAIAFSGHGTDPDGDTLTLTWDFGDHASGSGATPAHAYAAPGTYTATLTVTDGHGGTATAQASVVVANPPQPNRNPTASGGGPYASTVGAAIAFSGAASVDADQDELSFAWLFGDGSAGAGVAPTHAYSATGTYTATLLVGDGRGGVDTATTLVQVSEAVAANQAPAANAGGPYAGVRGQAVAFDAAASADPDGDALVFAWNFGDGESGTGPTPVHTYAQAGEYSVSLLVADGRGGFDLGSVRVIVSATTVAGNQPPSISAGGPYAGLTGSPVTFGATGLDPDGDALTFAWSFGDGTSGAGPAPAHTYLAPGPYAVAVTVSDLRGGSATASTTADIAGVAGNTPPIASAGGPYLGAPGQAIAFSFAASSDADQDPLTFNVDFGDGATGDGSAPAHTYSQPGTYVVTLVVSDGRGGTDVATTSAVVAGQTTAINGAPTANAGGPYAAAPGQPVQFDGSVSSDPDSDPLDFSWSFGDGALGATSTPSHIYDNPGQYDVALLVTDSRGGTAAAAATVVVALAAPQNQVPTATAGGPYSVTRGDVVVFAGAGSDADGDTLTLSWNFGDGSSGSGNAPEHAYQVEGDYPVVLLVSDGRGGSAMAQALVHVTPRATENRTPVANAGGPYAGVPQTPVAFDGSPSIDPDGDTLTFGWDFGDGTSGSGATPSHAYVNAGAYVVVLTVTDARGQSASTSTSAVIGTVVDRGPPIVILSAPTEALPGTAVVVTATAADDVAVTAVTFEVSGAISSEATSAPYRRTVQVPAVATPGATIHIRAIARDPSNNLGLAEADLRITFQPDTENPRVSLVLPPSGTPGASVPISATALDNVGIARVVFLVGGVPISEDEQSPYEATVTVPASAAAGSALPITARAVDFSGNTVEGGGTLAIVSDADTIAPTVSLAAPAEILRGSTLHLSATATDNAAVYAVTFFVNDVPLATDTTAPYLAELSLGAAQPAGTTLQLKAVARDFAGLESVATAQSLITAPVEGGRGIVTGEVYDDTSGLPLAGALVSLTGRDDGGAMYAESITSDARGRYLLRANTGVGVVQITRAGWTRVDRPITIVAQHAVEVVDARLTEFSLAASAISPVLGGVVGGEADRLTLPPGALQAAATLALTPVSQQGLQGLLPPGWSPVGGADLVPHDLTFNGASQLRVSNRFGLAAGTELVVARWDESVSAWRVVTPTVVGGPTDGLQADVPGGGQYAWLLPDAVPAAPPQAASGDLLGGAATFALPAGEQTLIDPQPRILFYRPGVRSDVRGTIAVPAPMASGLPIEARIVESYSFLAGTNVRPEPFVEDLVFYQVGGPTSGLAATFGVTPSQSFDPLTLQQGVITVELRAPAPGPRVISTLGPDGGFAVAATGETLQVPQGAVADALPVSVLGLTEANIGVNLPPGLHVEGAALVGFSGTLAQSAMLSVPKPAPLADTAQLLLVQAREIGGQTRLVLVGRGVVAGGQILSDTTLDGTDAFEGIRVEGRYFFVTAASAFGFARGQVIAPAGGPFAGALVTPDGFPIVSLSGLAGGYVAAAFLGPVALTARDLVNADTGAASGALGSAGAILTLDLQIVLSVPRVTAVTPADGVTNVALSDPVVIRFSKAIAAASVNGANAGNVRIVEPGGTPIAAAIALSGADSVATLRPASTLRPNTVYAVVVSTGVTDVSGRSLPAEVTTHFTSLDTEPPAMPAAGDISAVVPGSDGFTTITATQGTAAAHDTVTVVNLTQHTNAPVLLEPNGGFAVRVAAGIADRLQIVITDQHGNQTVVAVPRFRQTNADGSVSTAVTAEGGRVDGPGGVAVDVPVGAFPDGVVVTLKPVTEAQFPVQLTAEQRQVFQYTGGISIDLGGKIPRSYMNVSIATTGGETLEDQWIVGQVTYLNGQVFLDAADTARVIDGRIRTSSPPCPGVTGSGVYGFLKSARPLGVTYAGLPNTNAQLSSQFLVSAIATLSFPVNMPAMAGGAIAMAESVHAEFLNQTRQMCMPLLSGRTTVVRNTFRVQIPPAQLDDLFPVRIVVTNLATGKEHPFYPPFDGTVTVEGSNADAFEVESADFFDVRTPLIGTRVPKSFVRADISAGVFGPNDTLVQITNVTQNITWSSGLTGASVRPLGNLSAIVEGATGDTYRAEVTATTGSAPNVVSTVRTVAVATQAYQFGDGGLLLRTSPGTIDPTQAEIDAHNALVPADQRITGPAVIRVLLLRPGGGTEVILDAAAGNTARVASGALAYAFNGSFTERYSLRVLYDNGTAEQLDIPTFAITVRDGVAGSALQEIVGQVPPRNEPLRIDLGTAGAPATLATEVDGFFHVEVQAPITLNFSQGLDAQSVKAHMRLMFAGPSGAPIEVPGSWVLTDRNRSVTFVPTGPLQMGRAYQVVMFGVTAGGQPLAVNTLPIKTFEPVKLSSLALGLPHTGTHSVLNASVANALPFGDVEIIKTQSAAASGGATTVVASTTNQQGLKYHDIDVNNPRTPVEVGHTAGGMPKRLRVVPGGPTPLINIRYNVPLIGQQTDMSCWAAGAAMIVAFRDRISIDPLDIVRAADPVLASSATSYWTAYVNGLRPVVTSLDKLTHVWGLTTGLQSLDIVTVNDLKTLLEQYGPLWVGTAEGVGAHVRVITGISGDGTPTGTTVYLNDPWDKDMEAFELPNSGTKDVEEYFDQFVEKQQTLARRQYNDEASLRRACDASEPDPRSCQIINTPAILASYRQCRAGNQLMCDAFELPGNQTVLIAHLPVRPAHANPTLPPNAPLPLKGGATSLFGPPGSPPGPPVPTAAERISLLGNCATHVSIGPTGDPVFTGDLLVAPLYSSFGSSVNFFDVTDRANPCLLGGRPLTRNPETVPPPAGPDQSARGTVKQYGFARGAAILPTTNGLEAYIAVAELGLMPVSIGDNIPEVSPFARQLGTVLPGDYVDVVAVGEDLLALNNNFGGVPTLDAFNAGLSPIRSVSFEATRNGISKVHQVIVATNVLVKHGQATGPVTNLVMSLAFVAGANGITIVDVTDLENMSVIGNVPMPGIVRQLAVAADGKLLFAGGDENVAGGTRFFLIDVSDPFIPFLVDHDNDLRDDRVMFAAPYLPGAQGGIAGFDYDDQRGLAYVGSERSLDIWAIRRVAALQYNGGPVANAGPDAAVDPDILVTLDGTHSSDPDGDPLSYVWQQLSGPHVTLTGSTTAQPSFSTLGLSNVVLTFQLNVRDAVATSAPDTVVITVKRKERLLLTPVIAAVAIVPDSTPLTVTLESATGATTLVTADPQTSYKWITGGGLVPGVDGVPDVTGILNQMSAHLGIPVQLADITISPAGIIAVNTPGIQIVRAIHRVGGAGGRDIKSDLSVVLAGIELSDITLKPESAVTLLVGALTEAVGSKQNPPMILATAGNDYWLTTGIIVLDDVTFKFGGTAKISIGDLLDAIKPVIAIAMNAVLPVGGTVAGPLLVDAFRFLAGIVGTQLLNPIESSEPAVATVSQQAPFKGVVDSHAPGLAAISGTLSLGPFGTADDSVLVWVLPGLDSVTVEPNLTAIKLSDPATPGPKVRTFAETTAISTAALPISGKAGTAAELLDKFLPGGLASWSAGMDRSFFTNTPVAGLRFHVRGAMTPSCSGPDAGGKMSCSIGFSNVGLGFFVPNTLPLISNDYTFGTPSIAQKGDVEMFDTHVVHQNRPGESSLRGHVAMTGIGSADDPTARVVVGDGPVLVKQLIGGAAEVPPGTVLNFVITVRNPFSQPLTGVVVTDTLYFLPTGATTETVLQTQTLTVGTLLPGESRTFNTAVTTPATEGSLRNELSAAGSVPTEIRREVRFPLAPRPMINEVVVEPQRDWNDSGPGGDGVPFNDVPGTSVAPSAAVTIADQWFEFLTNTGSPLELTNWTLSFVDASLTPVTLTLTPANLSTVAGSPYVIVVPPTGVSSTSVITLTDTTGQVVDTISLAAIIGALGPATGVGNEAIARIPDGNQTNPATDFQRRAASIGRVNP